MKFFLVGTSTFLFAIVNIVSSSSFTAKLLEDQEKFYNDLDACQNETGATQSEVVLSLQNIIPTNKTAKCLDACLLTKLGVMKDEQLVPDKLKEVIIAQNSSLRGSKDESLSDIIMELAEECKAVTHPDKCESAAKIRLCLNNAAKKRGFWQNLF